mgnify:CR=1 FL=1
MIEKSLTAELPSLSAPTATGPAPRAGNAGEPDDAAVIERSWHEPDGFAVIFSRHAPTIARYLARRVGPQIAEDIVAETFLQAFRSRHRYDLSRRDARPWLYGIATNLAGRHRRTEARQLRALERTGVDPVVESFADRAEARVAAGGALRGLAGALARLRPVYRDALLLVAWADLSYEEAATALGVPVGTIRSRVSRARSALRTALGGVDPIALIEETVHE